MVENCAIARLGRKVQNWTLIGLVSLAALACQPANKSAVESADQGKAGFARLARSTYQVGDSIVVQLNRPLTQVSARWDNEPALPQLPTPDGFALASFGKRLGLHQLVIRGLSTQRAVMTDTVSIELWSDSKPRTLAYSVLQVYPHQPGSFTQGLEFYQDALYESTGQVGQSKLLKVDLKTGVPRQFVALEPPYFGEGLTIVQDRIYQLTWTSGRCFQYAMDMTRQQTYTYHTQGWGLTHRDTTLILSDGSNRLFFYTPRFQPTGEIAVYDDQGPVMNLNELEYIDGYVWANVWQTNRIVQIELSSGKVVGTLTLAANLPPGIDTKENVLNGIAYHAGEKALYITGKNWPTLYKLEVTGLGRASAKRAVARR